MSFITSILLLFGVSIQAASDCKPWRWDADGRPLRGNWNQENTVAEDNDDGPNEPPARLKPGDVNCREGFSAHDPITPDSCASLARFGGISLKKFFILNPTLQEDCSNIIADTQYCIGGYLEPLRAWDGKCGPPNKNATCSGTELGCCNSKTWTCGESEEDCAPGVCFEGDCEGDNIWSTDGTCGGTPSGPRACAGPWGDCCDKNNKCGTGDDFCSVENCQYGNCVSTGSMPFWMAAMMPSPASSTEE